MPNMRTRLVLLLLAGLATSGCISNMGELKETLGVVPPEPTYLPPEARAQANATSAVTGVPVRFTAEGSRDPQALPLTYRWSFGGGVTRSGAEVTYAFPRAGEWRVTLNVTNDKGLGDEASLIVQVAQAARPPVAQVIVLDSGGRAAEAGEMGERLRFGAAVTDPDNDVATYEWSFGDGATSHDAQAEHAYAAPGLYTVRLRVVDRAGLTADASRLVAVNGAWSFDGAFEAATGGDARRHAFRVAEGAREVRATLTFPSDLGANDLTLVLRDAGGAEVDRTVVETQPGAQGTQTRELVVAGEALRAFKVGEWTAVVEKTKGVQVEYALELRETF